MANIANIVVNDGKATPVAHTFYPSVSGKESSFRESISGLALIGQGRLSLSMKDSPSNNGMSRRKIKLELPVLETASANGSYSGYIAGPGVAYVPTVIVDFICPNRATQAELKDLRVLLVNILQNAILTDVVDAGLAPV